MSDNQAINEAVITYFGQKAKVNCDRKCEKAWGVNGRPRVQLSDNEDDHAYLPDQDLGEAPIDPGTYEGEHAKPRSPDEFPNKWCCRTCERANMSAPGEHLLSLKVRKFDRLRYNFAWREREAEATHGD